MGLSAGGVGCGVPEATAERFGLCGKGTAEFLPSVAEGGSEGGGIRMQSTARAVQGAEASQGHPSERASLARVPAPPCHPSSFPPSPAAAGPPSAERPPVSPARARGRPTRESPGRGRKKKKKKKSGSPLPAAPGRPQRAKRGPGEGGLRARTLSLWLARARPRSGLLGGGRRAGGGGAWRRRARAGRGPRALAGVGGRGGGAAPPAPRWALSANERRPHAAAAARGEAAADKCY